MPYYSLSRKEKLAFGAGDLGASMSGTIIGFFLLFYLTDVVGLNAGLAGISIFIGKMWDAFVAPLAGYLSDHTHSPWGRRRPYFLYAAIPYALSFFFLFNVVHLTDQTWLFIYSTFLYMLYTTACTFYTVPYMSLTPELTTNYDDRTNLTAYRMSFTIVGGLIAATLPVAITGAFHNHAIGFGAMGAVFAGLIILSPLILFFGIRERVQDPGEGIKFSEGIKQIWHNKPYKIGLSIFLCTWVAIDMVSAVLVYFLKYWMQMEQHLAGILGTLFITAILFLPFWVKISELYGKKIAYSAGIGSLIVTLGGICFLHPGQVSMTYVLALLAGIGLSAAYVIPYSVLPDCIDFGHVETGKRLEGVYYGFMSFSLKIISSLAILLVGQILHFAGYQAHAVQPASALWAIRLLLGVATALVLAGGIWNMLRYPINRERHQEILKALAARLKDPSILKSMVEVVTVDTPKDIRAFIRLPYRVYRHDSNWVPPLRTEVSDWLNPDKNPLLSRGPYKFVLAKKSGRVVARLGVVIDQKMNRVTGKNAGYIFLFESLVDYDGAQAVFDYAVQWLRDRGMTSIIGPVSPTTGDSYRGLLVQDFGSSPALLNSYNKAYYQGFFERYGFSKQQDLLAYHYDLQKEPAARLLRGVEAAKKRYHFSVHPLNLDDLDNELRDIKHLLALALPGDWAEQIPPTHGQLKYMLGQYQKIAEPSIIHIARHGTRAIGLAMALPDYNYVLKHLRGYMGPIGKLQVLFFRRRMQGARIFTIFVAPDFRKKGVSAAMYLETMRAAKNLGYTYAEGSTVSETNRAMQCDAEGMGGVNEKIYRIYEKMI